MDNRDLLYKEAIARIKTNTPQKESILYHNIYSLKMSGNYLYSSEEDVSNLVNFLNSYDN